MSRITRANRFALLCGASILSLSAIATPSLAMAQETTAPAQTDQDEAAEVGEIVVTGLRASLASAQSIKKNSEQFVDSITAVDIGRLPDVNVAEALQRVSGIQITRNYGEGSGIAIRGLTNVRSELNGRDIFSASGGRGLSWEEVGSDLLGGVDVYKNPSAEMIEGGLGGTINLKTRMPFDAPGRLFSVSTAYTHYDLANDDGYNASFLASDRWQTSAGEFGALLNMSSGETSFRQDIDVVEPYLVRTDVPGYIGQEIAVPNGGGINVGFGGRKRFSAAAALQWRPNDRTEFYLQALRTEYTFNDNGLSFFAYGGNGVPLELAPGAAFTVEDGVATSGSFINPGVDLVTFATTRDTQTTDISIGGKWRPTDRLEITADLQYIDSKVEQQTMNLTASVLNDVSGPRDAEGNPLFPGNYVVNFDTRPKIPEFSATNGYFEDIDNYGLTAVLPYAEKNDAESWAGRADMRWDFEEGGFFRDFRAGVRVTDRTAINRSTTYGTWTAIGSTCANWSNESGCYRLADFPEYAEQFPYNNSFLNGEGQGAFGNVWMFGLNQVGNPQQVFDFLNAAPFNQNIGFRSFDDPAAQVSNISETTYAAYGVMRFGSNIMGKDWDGNLGLRIVKTESASDGFETITYRDPNSAGATPTTLTIVTPIVGTNKYTDILPSLNLRMFLTSELQLRFAASQNVARPDFSQLNASYSISPTYAAGGDLTPAPGVPGTGTAVGNPLLDPQRVTALDFAVEWYFSPVGFVYATAFKKDIKDLFFNVTDIETYDLPGLGQVPFNITRLKNVDEGTLEGFEIGGQRFFDFLPSPFDGLGLQANYTFIDSNAATVAANAQTGGAEISVPIEGLSENSYNLVLLYEKYGFNARLAYNWRDDFLKTTQGVGTGQLPIFGKAFGVLDGSISYDFNERLAVTVDAQNILNTESQTYQITENRYRDYQLDDRRFSIRVRLRY
ncbi:MAG: TonB-dependent receptor [Brevundimonas sp.]|uniref:TonB-dependent receptor n=1 Tax=Brevundimonas sp. TaxID=1871086 RepID=UPI00271FE879|nr:TonB-dependent receptor [Brevundimonas sp.]MDO9609092.1 TonB-dependent receptor [Brevundimonas sp.]